MRILYLDIDTLRPDHLGCYGYNRKTSPNIDRVASGGVRFDRCYVSDAPCLPSRGSMFTGQFGIHNGIVNHGGVASDLRYIGRERAFHTDPQQPMLIPAVKRLGIHPVTFSSFAERHSAWWFCAGWKEYYNCGKRGQERAEEVGPQAIDWIGRNAKGDDWLLHVHLWDPHTSYRTPEDFGNPFEDQPLEGWYTEEMRRNQWGSFGPGNPQEPAGNYGAESGMPRQPDQIDSMAAYKKFVDGYDCGIAYADLWIGRILSALADQGVLDDTAIVITSDHGENMGELGVIGDHAVADHITNRVPMIIKWPGVTQPSRVDGGLCYQTDIAATMLELMGGKVPAHWDGRSFAEQLRQGQPQGRPYVTVANCAWSCQRSVIWDDYIFIRSYHTGLKNYPPRMLFNLASDPHETNDLAASQPALADHGQALLEQWTTEMMVGSTSDIDPLWTVLHEGGPFHAGARHMQGYLKRLRATGRSQHADFLEKNPTGIEWAGS